MTGSFEIQRDTILRRRPEPESHPAGAQLGAEGHRVGALHAGPAGRVSSTSERARNV